MIANKLYLVDPYLKCTNAKVTRIVENKIFLDRTIFFAEGGGQIGDIGMINELKVFDTKKEIVKETETLYHKDFPSININTDVAHLIENSQCSLHPGDTVNLTINWERRYTIMKLHSAAHIVLHFTEEIFGTTQIKGCSIRDVKSRLDFPFKLSAEKVSEIEKLTNKFIEDGHSIKTIPLENTTEAIYWICENIRMPCGGTHVANTKEIGQISLKRRAQGTNLDRIYIDLI